MAELDIGKHCNIKDCNRQDFLPFTCDACSGVFCLEHRSRESHSCPQEQEQVQREPIVSGVCTSHPCTFQECKGKELLPVICRCCEKHFCLAHRHPDDHKCEKLETPKPRMAATKELVQKIVESKKSTPLTSGRRKGAKNSATAAKVALMKLKMCACGDKAIPQVERAYFNVFLPKESKDCSLPLFFCTKWTLGKVIDSVASQAGLKNNNNILTAKKLRLCHPETGEVMKMDVPLLSLLDHPELPLHNGGNIILEYLDNGDTGLDDVRAYIAVP